MAINNALNINLVGTTGTVNFTGSTGATYVTPTLGAATATSLDFTDTAGIIATTTNDNAATGSVGEFVSSIVDSSSGVSLTSPVTKEVTNISLTAGDWDVWGLVGFTGTATSVNVRLGLTDTVSATIPAFPMPRYQDTKIDSFATQGTYITADVPRQRYSLSGTTTIYLNARLLFSGGTANAFGAIYARRMR